MLQQARKPPAKFVKFLFIALKKPLAFNWLNIVIKQKKNVKMIVWPRKITKSRDKIWNKAGKQKNERRWKVEKFWRNFSFSCSWKQNLQNWVSLIVVINLLNSFREGKWVNLRQLQMILWTLIQICNHQPYVTWIKPYRETRSEKKALWAKSYRRARRTG